MNMISAILVFAIIILLFTVLVLLIILAFFRNSRATIGRTNENFSIWIDNLINKRKVIQYFEANSIGNIVVIGLDPLSEKLIKELYDSDVRINYVVDDRYYDCMQHIPGIDFITNSDFMERVKANRIDTDQLIVSWNTQSGSYKDTGVHVESVENIIRYIGEI